MATTKWIAGTSGTSGLSTLLGTELNALANDAAATSAAVANQTNLELFADFELVATFATAPTADKTCDLYLIRSVDNTNYEDASATRPPANGYVGSFVLDNVGTQQRKILPNVQLPPESFKVLLVNKSGYAMTASGHTLRMNTYNQQVV